MDAEPVSLRLEPDEETERDFMSAYYAIINKAIGRGKGRGVTGG